FPHGKASQRKTEQGGKREPAKGATASVVVGLDGDARRGHVVGVVRLFSARRRLGDDRGGARLLPGNLQLHRRRLARGQIVQVALIAGCARCAATALIGACPLNVERTVRTQIERDIGGR